MRATALMALAACCCSVALRQATSTSQEPDEPIEPSGSACFSAAPPATRCETMGSEIDALPTEVLAGRANSIVAVSPSSTGDQYTGCSATLDAEYGPKT